jgi:hypothetical protein
MNKRVFLMMTCTEKLLTELETDQKVIEAEVVEEHRSIEEEIQLAKQRMHRMIDDPSAHSYWTGVLDGLTMASEIMTRKNA